MPGRGRIKVSWLKNVKVRSISVPPMHGLPSDFHSPIMSLRARKTTFIFCRAFAWPSALSCL
jgi:hypothetical protein